MVCKIFIKRSTRDAGGDLIGPDVEPIWEVVEVQATRVEMSLSWLLQVDYSLLVPLRSDQIAVCNWGSVFLRELVLHISQLHPKEQFSV